MHFGIEMNASDVGVERSKFRAMIDQGRRLLEMTVQGAKFPLPFPPPSLPSLPSPPPLLSLLPSHPSFPSPDLGQKMKVQCHDRTISI